ncbi:uncharacterized protein LOC115414162 isoform X3 [Sphaeramia orbicularis]|uniref:uncharacterized protein LOC115414162 isoform X3 n=1 Tax=Sphaeramia orbicularis TaxID=375764 RepID=UPI00117F8A5D|nr:uncharacterized protein LOC115414162 isoform X3 [Sphaeramia orbicularis]
MSVRLTSETPALGGKAQLHSDSFSLGLRIMLLWTTLYKAATDHYNQLSYPGQMDPAVSTKYPPWTSVLSVWDLYLPTSGLAMYAKMRLCSVTLKPVQGNLMTAARQSQQQNVELWSLWILTLQSKSKFMTWKILQGLYCQCHLQ